MTLWLKRALLCAVFAGGMLVIGAASALADEPATDAGLGADVSVDLEADVDLLDDPCSCDDNALLDADIDLDVEADVDLALGRRVGGGCRCHEAGDDGDAVAPDPDDGDDADPADGSNGGNGGANGNGGAGDEVGGTEVHNPSPGGNGGGHGGGTGDGTSDVMDQVTDVEGIDADNGDGEDGEDGNGDDGNDGDDGDDGNGAGNGGGDVDRDIIVDCSVTDGCLACLRILNRFVNLASLLVDVHDEVRIEARIGFLDTWCSRHETDLIDADADLDVKAEVDAEVSAQVDADVDAGVDLLDDRCHSCGGGSVIDADADLDVMADVDAEVSAQVDAEVDLLDEPCEGDGQLVDLTVG